MSDLPLTASHLDLEGGTIETSPAGDLMAAVRGWRHNPDAPNLVVLGSFGSGKSRLCARLAEEAGPPCTVVPLRDVARHPDAEAGLRRTIGDPRLAEARRGERILLLDGLDEVPSPPGGHRAYFDALTGRAGPRWMVTSRPGYFRTDAGDPTPDQVDSLAMAGVCTLLIDALPPGVVRDALADLPRGDLLLRSVEGLAQLATSPLLLNVAHAALPYIEEGRPIQAWGMFDAYVRHALAGGDSGVVGALEDLAWGAFVARGLGMDVPTFAPSEVAAIPPAIRAALLVHDLDGRLRFGHRGVYEFLLAARIAPRLRENQGDGPDMLSGVRITEATRVFLVGRVGPMPVTFEARRVRIPSGNFVAGGDLSPDERDLRIEHLARPFLIAREPVTDRDWAGFLEAKPDHRIDAHYLRHWGPGRRPPPGREDLPVYHLWPEDADRYAAWAGARLPTADEWEKAARGIDGRRWPWGDHWKPLAVTSDFGLERPLPPRSLGAQGDGGLFAAVGNVFEYTASAWRGRPDRGRVVMGGCYTHPPAVSRASLRLSHKLSGHLKAGLRLAWDV